MGCIQLAGVDIPCGIGECQMLSFISKHELKVYPARSEKFGKAIIHAIRDLSDTDNSHFLDMAVRVVHGETSGFFFYYYFIFLFPKRVASFLLLFVVLLEIDQKMRLHHYNFHLKSFFSLVSISNAPCLQLDY